MNLIFSQKFTSIIVSGDIHGDIMPLVNKVNDQYKIENSLIIVAGDVGIGFHKDNFYLTLFQKASKRLKAKNNILLFIRGNHDDPDKWEDYLPFKKHWQDGDSNIRFIKDYSVISAETDRGSHNILCVGGAISIDRTHRTEKVNYWPKEPFVYDESKVENLTEITDVITHSSPDFCEPILKNGIVNWIALDDKLEFDCDFERKEHTRLYNKLKEKNFIKSWRNSHFHFSNKTYIDGTSFKLCDIMELTEI